MYLKEVVICETVILYGGPLDLHNIEEGLCLNVYLKCVKIKPFM